MHWWLADFLSIYFTSQPGFLSYFAFLPFYFFAIDLYLQKDKKYPFILLVFVLFLTNYYLLFATTLITPIYFLYQYQNINQNLNGIVKSASKAILYYFIGFFCAGIFVVPSFFYILNNSRVGSNSSKSILSYLLYHLL